MHKYHVFMFVSPLICADNEGKGRRGEDEGRRGDGSFVLQTSSVSGIFPSLLYFSTYGKKDAISQNGNDLTLMSIIACDNIYKEMIRMYIVVRCGRIMLITCGFLPAEMPALWR